MAYNEHYMISASEPPGEVRLVDGRHPAQGRVEIRVDGEWGTICSYGWGQNDANTICRQLGYP